MSDKRLPGSRHSPPAASGKATPTPAHQVKVQGGYIPGIPDGGKRAASVGDVTGDLPRLPESEILEGGNQRVVDDRSLEFGYSTLGDAREVQFDPPTRRKPPAAAPAPAAKAKMLAANTAHHQQLIGNRYVIVSRIGQGGMGKVYKVAHTHLSRVFALKIISSNPAESEEARELFYREARFASAMSHPNITAVVDFGEDDAVGLFMVMELVEGEPLHKILFTHKQLPVRYACEVVLQVAEALHYIHSNGVVHCDIKTENIMVNEVEDGKRSKLVAKLLDFGLARPLSPDRTHGGLSGTPHYVAPERIRGEQASPASDVYSVGILLYELLTGRVPWDGETRAILSGHLDQKPTPPSQLIADGLDPALESLILRALAKRPADRHRDMAAFIYELRTVMSMLGIPKRKHPGIAKRSVDNPGLERDELARVAFDGCRLPIALINSQGEILCANPAFAKFVMGVAVDVEHLAIASTPLAGAWSSVDSDIRRTLAGQPVRRVIEIDVGGGDLRRLLLWLDGISRDQVVLGVQPLDG